MHMIFERLPVLLQMELNFQPAQLCVFGSVCVCVCVCVCVH